MHGIKYKNTETTQRTYIYKTQRANGKYTMTMHANMYTINRSRWTTRNSVSKNVMNGCLISITIVGVVAPMTCCS